MKKEILCACCNFKDFLVDFCFRVAWNGIKIFSSIYFNIFYEQRVILISFNLYLLQLLLMFVCVYIIENSIALTLTSIDWCHMLATKAEKRSVDDIADECQRWRWRSQQSFLVLYAIHFRTIFMLHVLFSIIAFCFFLSFLSLYVFIGKSFSRIFHVFFGNWHFLLH